MPTIRRHHRLATAALALAVFAAACGDDTPDASPSTGATTATTATTATEPSTSSSVPSTNEGGFGAPAAAPDEFGPQPGLAMTGSAELDPKGCWFVSGNGESALLVAPPGTRLGDDATTLVTADGTVIEVGTRVDATGGFVALAELPGGADGRWANYSTFCNPRYGFALVAEEIGVAFEPSDVTSQSLADALDASVFDTDYECGYGFTTGDASGRWALRIDVTTPMPPAAGPVSLPDDRFHASVTAGAHLFSNHCDDVAEWFEPEFTLAVDWNITSGRFDYPAASTETCSGGPPVTITLVDASVTTPFGVVALDPIEITNTAFGCFAG
jgi:hypothetical protein